MREFADEIDYKMEMDPEVVKENLRAGLKDVEKGDGSFKIRPIFINEDTKYTPLSPYDNSEFAILLDPCKEINSLAHIAMCSVVSFRSQSTVATSRTSATVCTRSPRVRPTRSTS